MTDRDTNGMQAQHWSAKDTSLTEKARDNLKSLVSDPKLRSLYEALTNVIIASVKDSYGKSSDKKYIYQTDMLMSRVRKTLTEKLSDLQIDSIKQLVIDNTKQQDELLSKMLLNAFSTLSVSIDKDTQNELVSKIAVIVDKLLQDYTNRTESSKESSKDSSKSKKGKSELSKVLDALKSDSKSQKVKELDIKQYQTKTVSLISKTLNAVNFNHKQAVESITAGFKNTNQTISDEVNQLQENIEDVKSNSLGSSPTKWFSTFILSPIQFLLKGLWNFILKPMFFIGKFLLKPLGFLIKGIWDNFIKKPIQKLINIAGTILGTVTSATTTALSTFFLTPKGAYALGYIVGYVWGRWIKPYIYDPIMRILQPFQGWINGDKTFTKALKDSWKQFKLELQPIKDAISDWWNNTAKLWLLENILKPINNWLNQSVDFLRVNDDDSFVIANAKRIATTFGNWITTKLNINAIPGFTQPALENDIPTKKTLAGLIVGSIGLMIFGPTIASLISAAASIANLGLNIVSKIAGSSWVTSLLVGIGKLGARLGIKIGEGLLSGSGVAAAGIFLAAADIFKGISDDQKNLKGLIDGTVSKDKKVTLDDIPVLRLGTSAIDAITKPIAEFFGANKEFVDKIQLSSIQLGNLKFGDVYKNFLDLYEKQKKAKEEGKDNSALTRYQEQVEAVKSGTLVTEAIKKHITDLNSVDDDVVYEANQNIIDLLSSSTASLIDKNGKITNQHSVDLLNYYISTLSQEQASKLKDDIERWNKLQIKLGQSQRIARLPKTTLLELNARSKNTTTIASSDNKLKLELDAIKQQLVQISKETNAKAEHLTTKEYKNALEAALDAYGFKSSNSSLADNIKLNETMLKDVSDNQDEFLKRMDKLQTTLEQMYRSKGKSSDEAKFSSSLIVNNFKGRYMPMHDKDSHGVFDTLVE